MSRDGDTKSQTRTVSPPFYHGFTLPISHPFPSLFVFGSLDLVHSYQVKYPISSRVSGVRMGGSAFYSGMPGFGYLFELSRRRRRSLAIEAMISPSGLAIRNCRYPSCATRDDRPSIRPLLTRVIEGMG